MQERVVALWESARATTDPVFSHRVWGPVAKITLGYLLLVEGVVQVFFGRIDIPGVEVGLIEWGRYSQPLPRGTILTGAIFGSLYALIAFGLILVYRANRIINFAQAQLGSVPAVAALLLLTTRGWNYFLVIPIVIIGAALLGGLVEVAAVRPFSKTPRLILTVITIGIGNLLLVLEFVTKQGISGNLLEAAVLQFPTPWSDFSFRIGVATFNGNHIVSVIVVAAVGVGLGAFFRFTDIGIAVRASAENSERASLLGIPVKRVSTVVWIIAAVLSSIGVFLRGPMSGLPLTGFVGLSIIMFPLAAAVLAKMESLPVAFVAAMFIGIVDRSAVFATNSPALAQASMLVVILIALMLQRGHAARAFSMATSSWQAAKEYRPIPAELRRLPEVRQASVAVYALIAVAVLGAPYYLGDLRTGLATQIVCVSIVGVSLVVLTGWAGQISLGQWSLAGIGAVVAGGMAANYQIDFFTTLFAAGFAGALVAVLIGLPALRIQGLLLAVTTLAFAFTVPNFVLRRDLAFGWFMPDSGTFVERPILFGGFDLDTDSRLLWFDLKADAKFYYFTLVFLLLVIAGARALRRNRTGRILIGIRDNERVMQAFGVNLARTKLIAFAISGFFAAIGGALFAYQQRSVDPGAFDPTFSLQVFVMTVIGGVGSIPGAIIGAIYIEGIPIIPGLREIENIDLLASGLGLLILLYFLPGGLAEGFYRWRDTFLRWVADRHDIHVPSLVADSLEAAEAEREASDAAISAAAGAVTLGGAGTTEDGDRILDCPVCDARLPVREAHIHDHFAAMSARDKQVLGIEVVTPTNGNGRAARSGAER